MCIRDSNKMELQGAIKALEYLFEVGKDELSLSADLMTVHLYTDSKYVKDGLTKWIIGWKNRNWRKSDGSPVLNQNEWKRLDLVSQKPKSFNIHWVKGHSGHPQNERCDQLCNQILDREGF